jgi:hypothetical protein
MKNNGIRKVKKRNDLANYLLEVRLSNEEFLFTTLAVIIHVLVGQICKYQQ